MSEKLKNYIREFYEQMELKTDMYDIQARELRSIQRAIECISKEEWDKISDKEKEEVNNIVNITSEWWCEGVD